MAMLPLVTRPVFINALHQRLLSPQRPGVDAHLRMAHPIRKADVDIKEGVHREAGVLITLFEKAPDDFHVILIRRGSGREGDKHAGQIGFPGGKREPADRDLQYTAMREAEEEIGLDLSAIDLLGAMTPLYIPVSKFLVHPFVAYVCEQPDLRRQESEIEEIIEAPLSAFRSTQSKHTTQINLSTGITLNHVPCFLIEGHVIWGATAMIMNELLEILD